MTVTLSEPMHADFVRILINFKKQYGDKKGTDLFYAWVNKHKLDDTKPYSNQAQLGECYGSFCESFRWLDEPLIKFYKSDDTGKYYKCVALTANMSMNKNDYSDVPEFRQAAGTLTWRPLNLNHDHRKFLPFPENRVDYAVFEDNGVETIIRIDNEQADIQRMIENGEILHPSIEATPRGLTVTDRKTPSKWNYTAMALLQKGVTLPGDPLTYLEPLPLNESLGKSLVESLSVEKEKKDMSTEEYENGITLTEEAWSTAYKNSLPDPCFAFIEPGGKKDADGKTEPRSLRHLPYKNKDGSVDKTHVIAAWQALHGARGGLGSWASDSIVSAIRRKLLAAARSISVKLSEEEKHLRDYHEGIDGMDVCGQCRYFTDMENTTKTFPKATGQPDDSEIAITSGQVGPGVGICEVATRLLKYRILVRKQDAACTDGRVRDTPTNVGRTTEGIDLSEIEKEAMKTDYENRLAEKEKNLYEETQGTNREREEKLKALIQVSEQANQLKDKERTIANLTGEVTRGKEERQKLRDEVDSLREQVATLTIGMTERDKDIKHYKDRYDAYERTHKELRDETLMLKEQLTTAINRRDDEATKRAESSQRALNAEQERARIANENALLIEKLATLQQEIYDSSRIRSDTAKTQIKDGQMIEELRKEREKLVEEIRDLKQKLNTQPRKIVVRG
jgi:hypothetical protein